MTGCSWGHPGGTTSSDYGCQYTYDIDIYGTGASTTGTIYGIYDMSGSSWEYVVGNYNDVVGNSGFSQPLTLDIKYYNKYTSSVLNELCNGKKCLSHALSETTGWYGDYQALVTESHPWLVRGGNYDDVIDAGSYNFGVVAGGTSGSYSFRLVMSPSL